LASFIRGRNALKVDVSKINFAAFSLKELLDISDIEDGTDEVVLERIAKLFLFREIISCLNE
jgi:hypothetical protein